MNEMRTFRVRLFVPLLTGLVVALLVPTPIAASTSFAGVTGWQLDGARGEELVLRVPGGQLLVIPGSDRGADVANTSRIDGDQLGVDRPVDVPTAGDVDGDGVDDLVVGSTYDTVDGRERAGSVVVVPGRDGRFDSQGAYKVGNPEQSRYFGANLVVDDLDRDGYADATSQSRGPGGTKMLTVLWGSPDGLSADRRTTYVLPGAFAKGAWMRAGNLDRDDERELVLLRPGRVRSVDHQRDTRGRMTVCDVTATALRCAEDWRVAPGIASVVVADVVAGGIDDVVLGQPQTVYGYEFETNKSRLWVYRGTRAGVDQTRTRVSLDTAGVPGRDSPYTNFGVALAAADVDGDGKADLLVGAPGQGKAGAITLLYGHRRGLGAGDDVVVSPRTAGVGAGVWFGDQVAMVDVDGNGHPDLVTGGPGPMTIVPSDERGVVDPKRSALIKPEEFGFKESATFPWRLPQA